MLKKTIGVGCMHFGFKGTKASLTYNSKVWKQELEQLLGSITNISDIEVTEPDIETDIEFEDRKKIPNLADGDCFPCSSLNDMNVKFKLYLPMRIQKDITGYSNPRTYTEYFLIDMSYSYYMPVTIVTPIDPSECPDPSIAVMLVRKFLEQKFEESDFNYIDLQSIGPSPFHADFYIVERDNTFFENNENYSVNEEKNIGYNIIEINYNKENFENVDDFWLDIEQSIIDEFGIFYKIIQLKNKVCDDWYNLEDLLDSMVKDFKKNETFGIRRSIGKFLDEILIKFSMFKMNEIVNNDNMNKMFSFKYEQEEGFIKDYLAYEIKEKRIYPSKEVGELLYLFEQRRTKKTEYVMLIISALLGGAIGSLLTNLFATP